MVSSLLDELVERGVDFSTPRLYILDGGKALAAAVRKHAGEAAFIQRCQVHKKRNVVERFINTIKQCRRVATRYEKTARNFLAVVSFASMLVLLN